MWKKAMRTIRTIVTVAVLVIAIFIGMFGTLYIGRIAEVNANRPCIVPGYETVVCIRLERENFYQYQVEAHRGTDIVVIVYTVSKLRKIYL